MKIDEHHNDNMKNKNGCDHAKKVYFKYMNGYWCNTCKDSFINGKWTTSKKNKKKK